MARRATIERMSQNSTGEHGWGFRTRAVHAGARPEPTTGARAVPIFQTTSFVFENAADAADLFALRVRTENHEARANRRVRSMTEAA